VPPNRTAKRHISPKTTMPGARRGEPRTAGPDYRTVRDLAPYAYDGQRGAMPEAEVQARLAVIRARLHGSDTQAAPDRQRPADVKPAPAALIRHSALPGPGAPGMELPGPGGPGSDTQPDPYIDALAAGHQQEYEPEPEPTEPPRCEQCGYLLTRCSCPGGPRGGA
jgi:hypothetical protein